MDFKTDFEIARETKHNRICALYKQLREENKDVSKSRILKAIAREIGMSDIGVRRVLVSKNLYV